MRPVMTMPFVLGKIPASCRAVSLSAYQQKLCVKLKPRASCFPKREIKSADEVRKISAALVMAEVGMAEGMQVLRLSKIGRKRQLIYRGLPLTSERLRAVIDCAI